MARPSRPHRLACKRYHRVAPGALPRRQPETLPMNATQPSCLNCATPLQDRQRFCANCGQKAATRRMTLADIGHDLLHAITHADHSVVSLVRALAVRPGAVAREYVDGRRKKYFNPFAFLVLIVGIAALVMANTRFLSFEGMPDNPVNRFLVNHLNLVMLGQVPLLAALGRLLFPAGGRNLAEHLVLVAYASGFRSIVFTVVVVPVWLAFHTPYGATVAVYIALWLVYLGIAYAQFMPGGSKGWNWLKGVLVGALTQFLSVAIITGSVVAYLGIAGLKS